MAIISSTNPTKAAPPSRDGGWILEVALHLALLMLLASEPVPGVNETHYLPKARHAFSPDYAARDLFFQSANTHWLATMLAGSLSMFFPLTAVAWIGRMLSWIAMAIAWRHLTRALKLSLLASSLALATWYLVVRYGNWAGEWAIGGFEAKSLAYPCIIAALGQILRGQWNTGWLWLGAAVAWHPLAGGWAGLSCGLLWLSMPHLTGRARVEWPYMAAAVALGMVGVWPALGGINSPNQVGNLVASQIHVYFRLYHHQCPSTFPWERHIIGSVSLMLLGMMSWGWGRWGQRIENQAHHRLLDLILRIAWWSVAFSAIGLVIDLSLSRFRPDIASKLLRFYWFRWSDVAVPLAWVLAGWTLLDHRGGWLKSAGSIPRVRWTGWIAAAATLGAIALQSYANMTRRVPAADDAVMEAPMNHEIVTDRFIDWLAVCLWIRENTPADSLWFTPKYQQTFKWYTGRAEVVCWKDVPQDNASVRAWYDRIIHCEPPRKLDGTPVEWSDQQILELADRYGFEYVLLDRTVQRKPLLNNVEYLYPLLIDNPSFAVFRILKTP